MFNLKIQDRNNEIYLKKLTDFYRTYWTIKKYS